MPDTATTPPDPYQEILIEIEKLQNKKTHWLTALIILGVSLLLFVTAFSFGRGERRPGNPFTSWEGLLLIIPILLFHELGHYAAMKIFGYRNLTMFFIPFFGAAVSGQHYTAPGWKKIVVALMGPLPGIVVGAVIGVVGMVLHNELLLKVALLTLILNAFNLLPILPLDGGQIMHGLFFARHYALDITFRALAAVTLIVLGILAGDRIFMILGGLMLFGIPIAAKVGRVAHDLKQQGYGPPPYEPAGIPPELAYAIIPRVADAFTFGKSTSKPAKPSPKLVAQHTLTVYETLCTRSPGWGATAAFAAVHLAAFVAAAIFCVLAIVAQRNLHAQPSFWGAAPRMTNEHPITLIQSTQLRSGEPLKNFITKSQTPPHR